MVEYTARQPPPTPSAPVQFEIERHKRGATASTYRKISLGSQSDAGERFAERMLSVSQTAPP